MDAQYADQLDECLTRLEAGATVEECLAAFPQDRAALEGPLRSAARLREQPWPAMPDTARAAIETRVTGRLAALRSGQAPAAPTPPARRPLDLSALLGGLLRALGYRGALPQPWLRLAAIGLGIVLALVLGAGAFAAARAIIDVIAPRPTPPPAATPAASAETFSVTGAIEQIGEGEWVVEGVPVAVDAQTAIEGTPQVGASATVRGVIRDDGALLAQWIALGAPASAAPTTQPEPSAAPQPTAAQPEPSAAPPAPGGAAPSSPLAALRALLEAGVAGGQVQEKDGRDLLRRLDQVERSIAQGKGDQALKRLSDMAQRAGVLVREGKMDAGFGEQVLGGIAAVAEAYGVQVAPADVGNQGGGNDDKNKDDKKDDKNKDKGKDKGKDKDK